MDAIMIYAKNFNFDPWFKRVLLQRFHRLVQVRF